MRRAASAPRPRLIRPLLSFALCFLLLAAPLTSPTGSVAQGQRKAQAGRGKRVKAEPARPGAPEASLPNLDGVRQGLPPMPLAPPPVPSTVRSRRKPIQPRQGRRVGDPLPTPTRPTPTPVLTPTPVPTPSPSVSPTPSPQGVGGGGMSVGFGPVNAYAGMKGYSFNFMRFIVSPSYDQPRSIPGPASYPGASFDLYTLPVLQAGGARMVFSSDRDGHTQIYLMNADGSGQVRLTSNGANDDSPRFSPNGTKVVFRSDRDNPSTGAGDIYVMNSDGTNQQRLTTDANDDCAPSWSPDGSRILFQSLRNGQYYQVYSMNADGSNQVNLSNSSGSDRQPSWSPDGARIAFASERDHAGYASVYVMNSNGTGQTRLTFGAGSVADEQPAWSRDGGHLAFVSTRDSEVESWQETDETGGVIYRTAVRTNKEVYVMNADGTGQTRLTDSPANDDSPSWSPDGTKLVFRSDRERDCCDPTSQVWVMNADGTGAVNLSGNSFGDYGASWASGTGNQPPVADAGGSYSGIMGQNTLFSGAGSFDPDGQIAGYSWSFGDGGTASGASPTHAYASAGTYTVTLTVSDNLGAQGSVTTSVSVSSSSSDGFVANFLQRGLARQPSGEEGGYWADILRAAYPKGQGSMLLAMREFGMTVFESAEYAARNRSDHWYVYDLYKTYLMRDPDPSGWAWWESQLPAMGREQLRQAFHESIEFGQIVQTLTASGPPSSAAASLATARVDPFNQPGDQLRARDCEWGVTLLDLPGRAGLDLGLSLSYSSLVWTRSGPYLYFDEDRGSPSPGFRLGFPTIRGPYFDAQLAKNVYLLVTPSGRRVELRQVETSNVYESGDSSYLQLIAGGSPLLRTADGTQMSFSGSAGGWRATLIEDSNGNYLSVNYDWRGDIANVTDTLGRVITFNYDANANLEKITQTWQVNGAPQTHTWARFGWGTQALQLGFGLSVVGTYSGEGIPVLAEVRFDDDTRYTFEHNASGQVRVIRRFSSDNVERARTTYDYATLADDCPRVTAARVWADNWTGLNGVPSEVVTQFGDPGDGSHEMTAPDGTVYKEVYGAGWKKGLTVRSEVRSGGALQKQTTTEWTQDDTNVNYQTNPRVTETNVYDFPAEGPGNRRRTTIDYGAYAQWGLPYLVTEYDANGTSPLRRSYTDYNLSQAYLDRRIIGLVSSSKVYDPAASAWLAKTTYAYDEAGSVGTQATTAVGHDQAYSSSFLTRGNVTSVSRWDVTDIENAAKAHTSHVTYTAAGSTLTSTDPAGHQTTVAYADSFSDGNNSRGTFAYPTTLTDADGFSTTLQYNFDFGAQTRTQGPPPAGQPNGLVQTVAYDSAARVERVTTTNNGAYARYVYGPYYVQQFSTVNAVADEGYSVQTFDGLGRVVGAASNHPNSDGGYKAQVTQYDLMGLAAARSNPAEIDGSWNPAGEDAAGWLYTRQTYDWKGRPRVTTNTDGTQASATYEGCGCAGGEVVTLTDEEGRQRKVEADVLGRTWKTKVLNEYGSVYSTVTNTYNALDQVREVKEQAGTDGAAQLTTMTYDGYGRLLTRHLPRYDAGTNVTYSYDADDVPLTVTDPRGVITTYGFTNAAGYTNRRHLVNSVTYSNAPAGVPVPAQVRFEYDAAGNRTQMTDEAGSVGYQYDTLSRLSSETRQFGGITHRTYTLTYGYNLAGQLTSLTDPFGVITSYNRDAAGQVTSVTGSGYPAIPQLAGGVQFASGLKYRAWSALREASYGDGRTMTADYDERLRVKGFHMPGPVTMDKAYKYEGSGALRFADDLVEDIFDRSYAYDHAGRLKEAHTGEQARGGAADDGPYQQIYTYDAFGHNTAQDNVLWKQVVGGGSVPYTNDRRQGWGYDAAGVLTFDGLRHYVNDAAGRMQSFGSGTQSYAYDGEGEVARVTRQLEGTSVVYNLRSTVLGGAVVSQLKPQSNGLDVRQDIIPLGDGAEVRRDVGVTGEIVTWSHEDPASTTVQEGGVTSFGGPNATFYNPMVQLDPVGASVGWADPAQFEEPPPPPDETSPEGRVYNNPLRPGTVCFNNFMRVDCEQLLPVIGQRTGRRQVAGVEYQLERDYGSRLTYGDPFTAQAVSDGETVAINSNEVSLWRVVATTVISAGFAGSGFVDGGAAQAQKPTIKMELVKKALGECISELVPQYTLVSFSPTTDPGSNPDDSHNGMITIKDVETGNVQGIHNDITPPADVRASMLSDGKHPRGRSYLNNPWWTYALPPRDYTDGNTLRAGERRYPDLYLAPGMRIVRVQIHEFGAILWGAILFRDHMGPWAPTHPDTNKLTPGHEDSGPAFEDCIGRRVYAALGLKPGP